MYVATHLPIHMHVNMYTLTYISYVHMFMYSHLFMYIGYIYIYMHMYMYICMHLSVQYSDDTI